MASRNGDAAVVAARKSGVIDLLCTTQADIVDVNAGGQQALGDGGFDGDAGEAYVVPNDNFSRGNNGGESAADAFCNGFVEFVRYAAADVVGLEAGEFGHWFDPFMSYFNREFHPWAAVCGLRLVPENCQRSGIV